MSLYLLAADDPEGAMQAIRDQVDMRTEDSLKRNVGNGLAELVRCS